MIGILDFKINKLLIFNFVNKPHVSHAHQSHKISIIHISKTCESIQMNKAVCVILP